MFAGSAAAGVELVGCHAMNERVPLGMGVADHGVAGMPAVPDVDGVAGPVDLDAVGAFGGAEATRGLADDRASGMLIASSPLLTDLVQHERSGLVGSQRGGS